MKTMVVGDLHLKASVALPLIAATGARMGVGRYVLLGDVTDDWGASPELAMSELGVLADWKDAQEADGRQVALLLGNHDHAYLARDPIRGTLTEALEKVREMLLGLDPIAAVTVGPVLVTHAGVTEAWRSRHLPDAHTADELAEGLNDTQALLGWEALASCGGARGGRQIPGPLWADLRELAIDPAPGVDQAVGHTPVPSVSRMATVGGRTLWACDTLSCTGSGTPLGDGTCLVLYDDGEGEVAFPFQDFWPELWRSGRWERLKGIEPERGAR
ncbi:metallophosphoesterase [Olsenella sp. YH-ols2217]|uniref:Metallophosphoesterase n=1 Tax=Kribbibacterium absianum TaxID=3044210 RepID=A0ABT6ZLC8_9ACTN|nr:MULTISPECIES: metallophosphoesterase [unclassified Olsenella]MDJ1121833.1 metallophosphoesterase [Olsenella sp. YH-ols2216]MDJ1129841.1 metallophosphoesterase [Olsenella sp. YH-ols2217]